MTRTRRTDRLLVLCWHNVDPTWFFPARPNAGRRGLARQLAFIRRTCTVLPLADGLRALEEGRRLPPRAVALTFDDGYRDQLELAVPALERLGLPATFFLVPALLSGEVQAWWERLGWALTTTSCTSVPWEGASIDTATPAARLAAARTVAETLKRRDRAARNAAVEEIVAAAAPAAAFEDRATFLGWAGARELRDRGFTVGSHSMCHDVLSQEDATTQVQDLQLSRDQLRQGLGVDVDLLAYPNGAPGDYDETTVAAARAAGYAHALTALPGWNRPGTPSYTARRFVMQPERGVRGLAALPLFPLRGRVPLPHWPAVHTR